jgi:tRNA pseudouridine38-40 synthase
MDTTSNVHAAATDTTDKNRSEKSGENGMADSNHNRGTSSDNPSMKNQVGSNRGRQQPQKRRYEQDSTAGGKKKKMGRNWEGATRRERNVDTRAPEEEGEKEERRPKKKVACFIGYSGEGYHGMQ